MKRTDKPTLDDLRRERDKRRVVLSANLDAAKSRVGAAEYDHRQALDRLDETEVALSEADRAEGYAQKELDNFNEDWEES